MTPNAQVKASRRKDFQNLLKEARIGYAAAQYEVGLSYANGNGVGKNLKQALEWFQSAAARGHIAAQYLLGSAYDQGIGTPRDLPQAFEWFHRAASQGDDKAQFRLGRLFSEEQTELAEHYLRAASGAGNADARFTLARLLERSGESTHARLEQALECYRQAADLGHAGALFALAMHQPDSDSGRKEKLALLRKASRLGSPAAQCALEELDTKALGRVRAAHLTGRTAHDRRDQDHAHPWTSLTPQSTPEDLYGLGYLYESGRSVPRNLKQARQNYRKAAQLGHAAAQRALARLTIDSDRQQAIDWYEKAARQDVAEAHVALADIHHPSRGIETARPLHHLSHLVRAAILGVPEALSELKNLLRTPDRLLLDYTCEQAARVGDASSQVELGLSFLLGKGVEIDARKALYWFDQAASQEHAEGLYQAAIMRLRGPRELQDHNAALKALTQAAALDHPRAQWELGSLLATGAGPLKRDPRKASTLCKKAAQSGFAPAQATLGLLFAQAGKHEQAVRWWESAAAQGDPEALFNLANACRLGRGLPADAQRARDLMHRAAAAGITAAQVQIGLTYATGENVPQDIVEACKWFLIAASKGDEKGAANARHARTLLDPNRYRDAEQRALEWRSQRA